MQEIALDLLLLLGGVWLVAVTLRPLGLPTVMGELIVGVLLGPAVFGLIEPGEAIRLLAEIGIFFLMFHAGIETQPLEFYDALKRSLGIAVVGIIIPFCVTVSAGLLFGLNTVAAIFVGLTMTSTAVVITLKSLKDLGLGNTRVARVILACSVIDNLITLVFFGLIIGVLSGGEIDPVNILTTLAKVIAFFVFALVLGKYVYPRLSLPFRTRGGKGFTFILMVAVAAGLFAEAIGLHMILGAYLAGLFFEEKVAHPNLVRVVKDRAYGIAYSFLGPIFFISLGFSITFDIGASDVLFIFVLTLIVIISQVISAGGMALRMGLPPREALTIGVGMCGRAEMAFIIASLALAQAAIDQTMFTALIFAAFTLNMFTPMALKGCAVLLEGRAVRQTGATRGLVEIDIFSEPLIQSGQSGQVLHALPNVKDKVVIYGYGPEVDSLISELNSRVQPVIVIEENEGQAGRLNARGITVVHASIANEQLDLSPLVHARALVANGSDDVNALLAVAVRELGFKGPLVALIANPNRRAPLQLAGATAAFTPNHVLAAAIAVRASSRIGPRITGVRPLAHLLEVAEVRIHGQSPLLNLTAAEGVQAATGAHIVAQWNNEALQSPPAADQPLQEGMILVAAGSPDSIKRLSEIAHPITQQGRIIIVGFSDVGSKLLEMLNDAGEDACVIAPLPGPGINIVGDIMDENVLEKAGIATCRVVILACETDSATLLAATVTRSIAPDVPIIACSSLEENVGRIQQSGADFALSVSEVAGQLLTHHILGEMVTQQARIKLVKRRAGHLAGKHPYQSGIRENTGCTVVAVERNNEIIIEIPDSLILEENDVVYVCGMVENFDRFYEEYRDDT